MNQKDHDEIEARAIAIAKSMATETISPALYDNPSPSTERVAMSAARHIAELQIRVEHLEAAAKLRDELDRVAKEGVGMSVPSYSHNIVSFSPPFVATRRWWVPVTVWRLAERVIGAPIVGKLVLHATNTVRKYK